ncbi:MAG: phosphohydrolase [candidate division Zixibacteria bacterium RBG_16_48_11]|nr:MAG: phosphohydrolase [candidate division Zixibacteria bacterium RBG_16_48_11]
MSNKEVQTLLRNNKLVSLEEVKKNEKIKRLIEKADYYLGVLGYTEHGLRHCGLAANIAHNIMIRLGRSEHQAQLAAIAAYMHDIGNVINRDYHAQCGAVLAYQLLTEAGLPQEDVLEIMAAIGNHDEKDGSPVNEIGAALVLADKSDVHRSRVRTLDSIKQDIHDRVNYAATSSFLRVDAEKKTVSLEIKIDTSLSSVMEYFEIFLSRMVVCRRAALFLGMRFELEINGYRLL